MLTHPAWSKIGLVKIGMTSQDPHHRAAQITSVSGLLAPCTVHYCVYVANRRAAETYVHDYLREFRVRRRRELFRVHPDVVTAVLHEVAAQPPIKRKHPMRFFLFMALAAATIWYFVAAALGIRPFPFVHAAEWALIDLAMIAGLLLIGIRWFWRRT